MLFRIMCLVFVAFSIGKLAFDGTWGDSDTVGVQAIAGIYEKLRW